MVGKCFLSHSNIQLNLALLLVNMQWNRSLHRPDCFCHRITAVFQSDASNKTFYLEVSGGVPKLTDEAEQNRSLALYWT